MLAGKPMPSVIAVVADNLLIETEEILDEARELLDQLPPLSPDHETVRLAVVRLRNARTSLATQADPSAKVLVQSRDTVHEGRTVVETIRDSVAKRNGRHGQVAPQSDGDGNRPEPSSAESGSISVFLDMDTVLLSTHPGRYGPELGLQADLSAAIRRLFQIADRVVVVVDPPVSGSRDGLDTKHRVETLLAGLDGAREGLVIATCDHGENGTCSCAKPGDGLIRSQLDGARPEDGWYIGGDQEGMVSGRTAGLRTIRIGPHGEDHLSVVHRPDYEARDLMDAANHIMVEALNAP